MILIYLLMALLGSAATVFALQNRDPVQISFLIWSVTGMPLALVILLSLLVGVTFASLRSWAMPEMMAASMDPSWGSSLMLPATTVP